MAAIQTVIVVVIVCLWASIFLSYFRLFLRARRHSIDVRFFGIVGTRVKNVDPGYILDQQIRAAKSGVVFSWSDMEMHHLAGGDVAGVVDGLISAKESGVSLTAAQAMAINLIGRDIDEYIQAELNCVGVE